MIEFRIDERGNDLLREMPCAQAIEVLRLNVIAFPESADAYDSLVETYLTAGLIDCAVDDHGKGVALDLGNMNATVILKPLTGNEPERQLLSSH